jgi:hypothetical protein
MAALEASLEMIAIVRVFEREREREREGGRLGGRYWRGIEGIPPLRSANFVHQVRKTVIPSLISLSFEGKKESTMSQPSSCSPQNH